MKPLRLALFGLPIALMVQPARGQKATVVESPFGSTDGYDQVKAIAFSDDSRHLVLLGTKGDKQFIVRDGTPGEPFDWVIPDSLVLSPGGRHVACVIQDGNDMCAVVDGKVIGRGYSLIGANQIRFSANGEHYAYTARVGEKDVIVVHDGAAGKTYPAAAGSPTFSPDGLHLAYGVVLSTGRMCVVLDDKEQKIYDGIASATLAFSPDSRHFAYTAVQDHKYLAVIDGQESKPLEAMWLSPVFSPDSAHAAYVGGLAKQFFLVYDGKEGPRFDAFDGPVTFSPDSRHTAYVGRHGKQSTVIRDGMSQEQFDEIAGDSLRFSPDSAHLAYAASSGAQRFIVLDASRQPGFDHIARPGLMFSPDSKRLAYAAVRGQQLIVVCDATQSPPYENVVDFQFSPDSRHFAYRALAGKQLVLGVDGKPPEPFDAMTPVAFSSDGAHYVFAGLHGTSSSIYLDDTALPNAYTAWIRDSSPVFASPGEANLLMARDRNLIQVRVQFRPKPAVR